MRERFNVLNHIIWAKPSGRWNGCNKESLRAYFPATERVLFAEHYQGPYRGKSDSYAAKERELKQYIMAPLISYFRDARAELGITAKQIAEATGKKNMVSHWFGASQWQLPNEADYRKLQALFSRIAAEKFTGLTVAPASASVKVGATTTLTFTVKPDGASDKAISVHSTDPQTATVTLNGLVATVKGVKQGSVSIVGMTSDGDFVAVAAVAVSAAG
ncbi:DNA methylase [Escherichia coli]|nr:DNA methylase [Escherichia coli]